MIFLGPLRQLSRLCTASLSVIEKKYTILLFIKMAVELSVAKDVEILINLLFHIIKL